MNQYKNNVYNFQISYPEHWDCMEKVLNGRNIIYVYYNNITDGIPNINLNVYCNLEASILDIVKATKQEIRNYLRRIKIIESKIIDDQRAVLIYEGERDGIRYYFKQVILKRDTETLSITATCKIAVLQVYEEELEEILLSVKFLEKCDVSEVLHV